ncbi:hypothetical protein [Sinomonas atrocyanea]
MGIACNLAVAIFGGTTPIIVDGLIQGTGNDRPEACSAALRAGVDLQATAREAEACGEEPLAWRSVAPPGRDAGPLARSALAPQGGPDGVRRWTPAHYEVNASEYD